MSLSLFFRPILRVSLLGGQGQGDLYVVGLSSVLKVSKGILQESAARCRLPAGLRGSWLVLCNEGWCGINEKCEYQVVARQRKVVFQSFCKRSLSSEGGTTSILLWTALRTPAESRRSGASTPGQRGLGSAPGRNRGTCRGIVALLLRPSHSLLRVRRLTRLLKSEHQR